MKLSKMYDKSFFTELSLWLEEYKALADVLVAQLKFKSALDLGCGNGLLLACLHKLGKTIQGVDGSPCALLHIPKEIKAFVALHDLTQPLSLGRFDLVICSEVAEHIHSCYADALIKTICQHSTGYVYFTAAVPGQGGAYHVNEQPLQYWIKKFEKFGFHNNSVKTERLQNALARKIDKMWWLKNNSMIFCANQTPDLKKNDF